MNDGSKVYLSNHKLRSIQNIYIHKVQIIPQMLFITSLYEDSYARWYARVCIYSTKKSKFNILEKVYYDTK